MTRFSLTAIIFCLGLGLAASAVELPQSEEVSLAQVLDLLERSQTGHTLLQKAMQAWNLGSRQGLMERLRWGSSSRTDAILIRHYDADTGKESRERKVTVYLRRNQHLGDVMLDLAHELVHATSRPSWDPYDPNLTPGAYIRAAIEGEGGEVDAVRVECQVSLEIYGEHSKASPASRCSKYGSASTANASQLIRQDFYRVGNWISELRKRLGSEEKLFPLLSKEKPALYSSTGGTPYPVALYEEYQQITSVACENTKRRAPASSWDLNSSDESRDSSARLFLLRRCNQ